MTKVCISGYYGFDNVGDEAILLAMIEELQAHFEDLEIVVLSNNPAKTAATYGVEACDRWKWRGIHKALMSSDLLISGGGGLLQDVTGKKSLLYYTHIMKMAMRRKKPVFIFDQGIGPISSKWGQDQVAKVLRKATKITVRDEDSARLLQSWGLRKGRIRVTADPVLTLGGLPRVWDTQRFAEILDPSRFDESNLNADHETEIEICLVDQGTLNRIMAENAAAVEAKAASAQAVAEEAAAEQVIAKEQEEAEALDGEAANSEGEAAKTAEEAVGAVPKEAPAKAVEVPCAIVNYEDYGILGLHPSAWKEEGENLAVFALRDWANFPVADIAKAADMVAEAGYKIVFLPFQYPADVAISQKVMDEMEYVAELFDAKTPLSPQEILTIMDEADFVFGMRLHSLIMAAVTKTPFASLSYNPKVTSFVQDLGLTATADLEDYDSIAFFEGLNGILANPEAVSQEIGEHLEELTERADSTMELIHTILDRMQRRAERKSLSGEEKKVIDEKRRAERIAFREEMHLDDAPKAADAEVKEELAPVLDDENGEEFAAEAEEAYTEAAAEKEENAAKE